MQFCPSDNVFYIIHLFVAITKFVVTITRSNQFAKFGEMQNLFGHMDGGTSWPNSYPRIFGHINGFEIKAFQIYWYKIKTNIQIQVFKYNLQLDDLSKFLLDNNYKKKNIQTKMVPHSIRGPSCESMNVVFAIRHLRQCKICYHIEGHFLLINQSNHCWLSLSLYLSLSKNVSEQ